MPIGSYAHRLSDSPAKRFWFRVLGTLDLHGHYRIRLLLRYVESAVTVGHAGRMSSLSVIELGCGGGSNLLELAERFPNLRGLGYDINPRAIESARSAAQRLFPDRFHFCTADATCTDLGRGYDLVLLMDFLEHVDDPRDVLSKLGAACPAGSELLISVPTPRYPRVFGRRFHEEIGHLVDGYTLEQLSELMPAGFQLVYCQYNTGLLASLVCAVYYRWLRLVRPQRLRQALALPFILASWCDCLNGAPWSSSLFAVYRKTSP